MSGLESKVAENGGDAVAPPADVSTAMKVVAPNPETISAAEALKLEGNALLAGEPVFLQQNVDGEGGV